MKRYIIKINGEQVARFQAINKDMAVSILKSYTNALIANYGDWDSYELWADDELKHLLYDNTGTEYEEISEWGIRYFVVNEYDHAVMETEDKEYATLYKRVRMKRTGKVERGLVIWDEDGTEFWCFGANLNELKDNPFKYIKEEF